MFQRLVAGLSLFLVGLMTGPSPGGASDEPLDAGIVSELKLGVLAHAVPVFGSGTEEGADINAEILFESPDFLEFAFAPRPHLGGDVNVVGDTSMAYFGLTWEFHLVDRLWLAFGAGGAVHDGKLNDDSRGRLALGSRVLFHEKLELGLDLDAHSRISVYGDHASNAFLADHNDGLSNLGLRYGYRF